MPVRPAAVLTLSYFAPGDTNVFPGPIRQHSNPSTKLNALALFSVPIITNADRKLSLPAKARTSREREEGRTLVEKLRKLASEQGYTKKQIASEVGVSFITVNHWLTGHSLMAQRESIERLGTYLGWSLRWTNRPLDQSALQSSNRHRCHSSLADLRASQNFSILLTISPIAEPLRSFWNNSNSADLSSAEAP
jgi:transcriptional regulator with XRE-family HTH domain